MSAVSIIGLGWIGEPLALALLQQGYDVYGSVRQEEKAARLQAQGVYAKVWNHSQLLPDELKQSTVVVTLPPGKTPDYLQNLTQLLNQLVGQVQHILFFSSTSVYRGVGILDETTPPEPETEQAAAILAVEEQLQTLAFPCWQIVRPAGLINSSRHPARFLSGKQRDGGGQPVNLVHQSDVVAAVIALIQFNESGVFNLVAPSHPSRDEFYSTACQVLNLPLPEFTPEPSTGKVISGDKIEQKTVFRYHIRDWMHWQTKGMSS